jgi:hypothetical protein
MAVHALTRLVGTRQGTELVENRDDHGVPGDVIQIPQR